MDWNRGVTLLIIGWFIWGTTVWGSSSSVLHDIRFTQLSGHRGSYSVSITLVFAGAVPEPQLFATDHPPRLTVDLPQTSLKLSQSSFPITLGPAQRLVVAENEERSRLVIHLHRLVPYQFRRHDNRLELELGTIPPRQGEQGASPTSPALTNVDFQRGNGGEGRVLVGVTGQLPTVEVHRQGGHLIVDFPGTYLPTPLLRRLEVRDFATPIHTIDALRQDSHGRLVMEIGGEFEELVYQVGSVFTIEVRPIVKEQTGQKPTFTGERLSLNFQNIDVRAALQIIADFSGLNLVTSETVQGSLTLRLRNLPWDQALDVMLKSKGLTMRRVDSVIMIAPSEEIAAREKQELEAQRAIQELAPLRTEFISLNHAKAADVANLLKAKDNAILTPNRGNVTVDERTNGLLVQDSVDKLLEIHQLIATLDVPVRQVLIESRIVIADDTFAKDLGTRFGVTALHPQRNRGAIITTGQLTGSDALTSNTISQYATTTNGSPLPITPPSLNDRLNVSLPANPSSGTPGSIALTLLSSRYLVDLELSALQTEHRGEIISNPRLIATNQKEASIEQGVEYPYQQASSSGATNVAFKKAVLALHVTPQISPDERIFLTIRVNKDSRGELTTSGYAINTQEVNTQVLVNNGETVVLGGIYQRETRQDLATIPFLGELPVLGTLFRNKQRINNKSELLVFVTPRIVKPRDFTQ